MPRCETLVQCERDTQGCQTPYPGPDQHSPLSFARLAAKSVLPLQTSLPRSADTQSLHHFEAPRAAPTIRQGRGTLPFPTTDDKSDRLRAPREPHPAVKMALVYADVNKNMPRSYWDYDSVNISQSEPLRAMDAGSTRVASIWDCSLKSSVGNVTGIADFGDR